jgi:hypothetical protein
MCLRVPLVAQKSVYQDADGNTSIYLLNANGNLTFNVSDTKFDIGIVHEPAGEVGAELAAARDFLKILKAKTNPSATPEQLKSAQKAVEDAENQHKSKTCHTCIYGVEFSGKPSTDLANQLFQSGNSPASISGGGSFGFHGLITHHGPITDSALEDDWLLVNMTYTRSTFNTITAATTTPTAQHFNGFSVMPTMNLAFDISGFNFILGTAVGVSETNNVGDLKKVSVSTTDAQSGTVAVVESKDAYLGDYATAINVPIYSDFIFIPHHLEWLSFQAFERANVLKATRYAEGGFGVFLATPKAKTKVLGGLNVGWKDGDRTIALVGGWTF